MSLFFVDEEEDIDYLTFEEYKEECLKMYNKDLSLSKISIVAGGMEALFAELSYIYMNYKEILDGRLLNNDMFYSATTLVAILYGIFINMHGHSSKDKIEEKTLKLYASHSFNDEIDDLE